MRSIFVEVYIESEEPSQSLVYRGDSVLFRCIGIEPVLVQLSVGVHPVLVTENHDVQVVKERRLLVIYRRRDSQEVLKLETHDGTV